MKKIIVKFFALISTLALISICSCCEKKAQPDKSNQPVTIMIAAAASLEYSFRNELIPQFQKKYPWITVEGTYDSSGKLQIQIE